MKPENAAINENMFLVLYVISLFTAKVEEKLREYSLSVLIA